MIKKDDFVKVKVGSDVRFGTVKTAHNYGSEESPDWYIEFDDPYYGATYWKQSIDGGEILETKSR